MLEELDFEDDLPVMVSKEVDSDKPTMNEEKEDNQVCGETLGDDIPDDLEEGEIGDASPVAPNNNVDTICQHFQRGTCLFGSQCRFTHTPGNSYKMFDSVISGNNNHQFIKRPTFYSPVFFHQTPMHSEPEAKSAWEIGIENSKKLRQQAHLKKIADDLGLQDNETAWEISLQETKAMIQEAGKKKSELLEIPTIYSKEKELKEHAVIYNSENRFQSKKMNSTSDCHGEIKDNVYDTVTKVKSAIGTRKTFYNWNDPWRRSKSPKEKKRPRFRSISSSPPRSHSGKRSSRSSSSSSSCFKCRVYGSGSQQKCPPEKKRLKSKSCSISPRRKLCNSFRDTSCAKGDWKRSVSRSFIRSPLKKGRPHSCSLSKSSSASSCSPEKKCRKNSKSDKELKFKKFSMRRSVTNLRRSSPKPKWKRKSHSGSPPKWYLHKNGIVSSPHHTDDGNSSNMTVSSSSSTSDSSVSDSDSSQHSYAVQKDKNFSKSKISSVSHRKGGKTLQETSTNRSSDLYSRTVMTKSTYNSAIMDIIDQNTYLSRRSDTRSTIMDRAPSKQVFRTVSIKPFSVSNTTKLTKHVDMETEKNPLAKRSFSNPTKLTKHVDMETEKNPSAKRSLSNPTKLTKHVDMETEKNPLAKRNAKHQASLEKQNQRKPKPSKTAAAVDSLEILKYQVCMSNNSSINEGNKLKLPKKAEVPAVSTDTSKILTERELRIKNDPIQEVNKLKPSKTSAMTADSSELIRNVILGKNEDSTHKVNHPKPKKKNAVNAGGLELLKYQACVKNSNQVEQEVCIKSSDSIKSSDCSQEEIANKKELLCQQLKLIEAAIARKRNM